LGPHQSVVDTGQLRNEINEPECGDENSDNDNKANEFEGFKKEYEVPLNKEIKSINGYNQTSKETPLKLDIDSSTTIKKRGRPRKSVVNSVALNNKKNKSESEDEDSDNGTKGNIFKGFEKENEVPPSKEIKSINGHIQASKDTTLEIDTSSTIIKKRGRPHKSIVGADALNNKNNESESEDEEKENYTKGKQFKGFNKDYKIPTNKYSKSINEHTQTPDANNTTIIKKRGRSHKSIIATDSLIKKNTESESEDGDSDKDTKGNKFKGFKKGFRTSIAYTDSLSESDDNDSGNDTYGNKFIGFKEDHMHQKTEVLRYLQLKKNTGKKPAGSFKIEIKWTTCQGKKRCSQSDFFGPRT
ncbi:unnamed protein product, partial [Meganyctiphanes norvegica]